MEVVTIYDIKSDTRAQRGDYVEFANFGHHGLVRSVNSDDLFIPEVEIERVKVHQLRDRDSVEYFVVSPQLQKLGFNFDVVCQELDDACGQVLTLNSKLEIERRVSAKLRVENEGYDLVIREIKNATFIQRLKWLVTGVR